LFYAQGKHSAHSPFLFSFVTKVINTRQKNENCKEIESLRKSLCKSEKEIRITDFGAGSSINKTSKRKIKDIAHNSAKNAKFGQLLYRICNFFSPNSIVELGTSLGISTSYLAKGNLESNVFTFEGCPETAAIARENFKNLNLRNVDLTIGEFKNTLSEKLKSIKTIDLAFIDGNHQEESTIAYFEEILKFSNNNTIFIFDDIHWSSGMENAWDYIKTHAKTSLTIDLFFVGIVFIKSELSKEDFIIRF
jgi:predicted O-methyltransferase YrrM